MIARIILAGLLALAPLAGCSAEATDSGQTGMALAPSTEDFPGQVRDAAQIINPELEERLAAAVASAKVHYGPELAIVTVKTLDGFAIEDYSLNYARHWGFGSAERSDGLMILVAPNERKVRIEVGSGIEDSFTDLFCKDVIERLMIPAFKDGDFGKGIEAGTTALIERMQTYPTIPANDNDNPGRKDAA